MGRRRPAWVAARKPIGETPNVDHPEGPDLQLVEVRLTAVEGWVSEDVQRRLIEANLAVLEPLVEHLHRCLDTWGHGERAAVAGPTAG